MELKTQVDAKEGKHDILVTRTFDLPLHLLFKAFAEPEIVEQWMGTKVLQLESRPGGSFLFETAMPRGGKLEMKGVIHEFIKEHKIIRTFEMTGMSFGVQLEVFSFEHITDEKSRLIKHIIYESVEKRNENLKLPFKQGINSAHNRLEKIIRQLK